jgi:hypothetical protein
MQINHIYLGNYKPGNGIYSVINPLIEQVSEINHKIDLQLSISLIKGLVNRKNIYIIHGYYYPKYIILSLLLFITGNKFYIKPHGGFTNNSLKKSSFKKYIFLLLTKPLIIATSSGILFINEQEKNNSIKFKKKTFIIKNVIFKINSNNNLIKKIHVKNKLRFLMINRIDIHHKGLDVFLDFMQIIPKELKDKIEFTIYGSGDTKDETWFKRKIVKFKNINYMGLKKIENIDFSNYDYSALFSRYEGLPTSLIEGLSKKLPVFISEQCNLSAKNIGYTFDVNDLEDIVSKLILLNESHNLFYSSLSENAFLESQNYLIQHNNIDNLYKTLFN